MAVPPNQTTESPNEVPLLQSRESPMRATHRPRTSPAYESTASQTKATISKVTSTKPTDDPMKLLSIEPTNSLSNALPVEPIKDVKKIETSSQTTESPKKVQLTEPKGIVSIV